MLLQTIKLTGNLITIYFSTSECFKFCYFDQSSACSVQWFLTMLTYPNLCASDNVTMIIQYPVIKPGSVVLLLFVTSPILHIQLSQQMFTFQ